MVARLLRHVEQPFVHIGKPRTQAGNEVLPDPAAQVRRVLVGRIIPVFEGQLLHHARETAARELQHGSDDVHLPRGLHAGEAGRAGASQRPHEHGLYLVIGVMCREDAAGGHVSRHAPQRLVAPAPCRRLGAVGIESKGFRAEVEAESLGMPPHQRRDGSTVGVNPMIHVSHYRNDPVFRADLGDELEQGDRVESAGHSHEPGTRLEAQGLQGGGELLPCFGRRETRLGRALRPSGQVRVPARRPG